MPTYQELEEIRIDVERAFKTALFSMDYQILRVIMDTAKSVKSAFQKKNYKKALFINNKGFWDIGICIKYKLSHYPCGVIVKSCVRHS